MAAHAHVIHGIAAEVRRLDPAEVRRIYRGDETLLYDPPGSVAVLVALMLDAGRAAGCVAAAIAAPGEAGNTTVVMEGWFKAILPGGHAANGPPPAIVAEVRRWAEAVFVAPYTRALAGGGGVVDVSDIQ